MSAATCQCGGVNQWDWVGNARAFTCIKCGRGVSQVCVGLDPVLQVPALAARQALADAQWALQQTAWAKAAATASTDTGLTPKVPNAPDPAVVPAAR